MTGEPMQATYKALLAQIYQLLSENLISCVQPITNKYELRSI